MKQVYREIKEQLTPDRRTVNELLDRINGREPAVLKTSGMRWAALVPLTAVLGLVLLGGMLKLGSDNDIETKEISRDTNSVVEQQIKEYGYPAAQVETPVVVEDGKFDFQNGGYYSMEKHQPKDPPDEETKKRLLKQNLSISVMNGDPAYIVDDNASDDDVAFVDQDGHKWVIDPASTGLTEYKAVDEEFNDFYHVSRISHYLCMGKVKDGDRIYELLVGYTGFGEGYVAISFGDGRYYLYEIPDYKLQYSWADFHMVTGENWGPSIEMSYEAVIGNYVDYYTYNNGYEFNEERLNAVIEAIESGRGAVSMQNDDICLIGSDGHKIYDGSETSYYTFLELGERSDFDDNDLYGFGDLSVSINGFSRSELYSFVINSPDENGVITALLPNDLVVKFKPKEDDGQSDEDYHPYMVDTHTYIDDTVEDVEESVE